MPDDKQVIEYIPDGYKIDPNISNLDKETLAKLGRDELEGFWGNNDGKA